METARPYRSIFWKHKVHYFFIGICAAIPILAIHPAALLFSAALYVIGLINIPDMKFFKDVVDREENEKEEIERQKQIQHYTEMRNRQYSSLNATKREMYDKISSVCTDIEAMLNGIEGREVFLTKIDEIMFTYLKLLTIQQSIEKFIEVEGKECVDVQFNEVDREIKNLEKQIEELKKDPEKNAMTITHKERILNSTVELAVTVKNRLDRFQEAQNNVEIVAAEESKLVQQLKLLRGEVVAARNTSSISAKIEAGLQMLGETNKMINQMNQYREVSEEMPDVRIGFETSKKDVEEEPSYGRSRTKKNLNDILESSYISSNSSFNKKNRETHIER